MNDKSFQIIDENGNLINCEIICIVPNEEDSTSSYIVYTDFKTENGYKLLCGELKETDGSYTINKITDDTIIDLLKEHISEEMAELIDSYKDGVEVE